MRKRMTKQPSNFMWHDSFQYEKGAVACQETFRTVAL